MRRDAARNRQLLIEAAREVFARRGLEASLDEIARQAGVGVGTAYRHFGNKFDLAQAVMEETLETLVEVAEKAAVAADPWAGFLNFLESALTFQTRDRGLREVMMGMHDPERKAKFHDRLGQPVDTLLERCKQARVMRDAVTSSDVGFVVMMLCQVADVAGDTDSTHSAQWRRYLPTLVAGLRPDGPPLDGEPLTEQQFRDASTAYLSCRAEGRNRD